MASRSRLWARFQLVCIATQLRGLHKAEGQKKGYRNCTNMKDIKNRDICIQYIKKIKYKIRHIYLGKSTLKMRKSEL